MVRSSVRVIHVGIMLWLNSCSNMFRAFLQGSCLAMAGKKRSQGRVVCDERSAMTGEADVGVLIARVPAGSTAVRQTKTCAKLSAKSAARVEVVPKKKDLGTKQSETVRRKPAAATNDQHDARYPADGRRRKLDFDMSFSIPEDKKTATLTTTAEATSALESSQKSILPEVMIQAIARNMAINFPLLPRPPSIKFYRMLRHILNCKDVPLCEAFKIADQHRQAGHDWP